MTAPFDINLRHLRAVSAIVARGSIRAAAEAIGLSQPAVTQGLAKLERRVGVTLFERGADGMTATPAGRLLSQRVDVAMTALSSAVQKGVGGRRSARIDHLVTATQLRALLALADTGSFVGAAAAVGLSQPALHGAVRDLEQIVGIALLERRGRGVAFTQAGWRVTRGARLAHAEIAAGLADITPDDRDARLHVGAMPLCRARLLPDALSRLLTAAPRVHIDVAEGSWRELIEPLRDGSLDLLIGALRDPCPPDLSQVPLFVDRLVVIGRAGHPLSSSPATPPAEALARFSWIVGRRGSPLRDHWEQLFAGHPLPHAPVECGSVLTTRGILQRSNCLTLLSPEQVRGDIANGTLAIIGQPLVGHARTIGITTRLGWQPTQVQTAFLGHLADCARQATLWEIQ